MVVICVFMDLINTWKILKSSIILHFPTLLRSSPPPPPPPPRVTAILHFVTKSEIIYWPVSDS